MSRSLSLPAVAALSIVVGCASISATATDAAPPPTFTLTVTVTGSGDGVGTVTSDPTGIACGSDCAEAYDEGTMVTLTAAATGSTFVGWTGGGCTGTGSCLVSVTAATMVTATFAPNQVALSVVVTGTGMGTVTSSPAGISCGADCTEDFDPGTAVTLTATPATGSAFAGWAGGGCAGTGACVVTGTTAVSVAATFTLTAICDGFTSANTTTIGGWTERVGDWIIDAGRLRDSTAGTVYSHHITMNGSTQLDGCARLTAINNRTPSVTSAGVILRWSPPNNYIVALVQDNSSSGNFNSAWIYQYPGVTGLGTALTNQTFGLSPNLEACVVGTTVTLRIDANQDGTYEASTTGTTTITTAGLTGIMALTAGTHPSFDNFCWGP